VGFRGKYRTARSGPRAPRRLLGKRSFGVPITYRPSYVRASSRKHKMSEAKFNKAVAIIQSLPKDGPIRPSQDDQLYVRTPRFFLSPNLPILISPQPAVLQLLQARCVLRGAITGHLGPYFPGFSNLATIGDVNTARPGILDFTGKAKWCVFSDQPSLP
jgi:hypothetical protein